MVLHLGGSGKAMKKKCEHKYALISEIQLHLCSTSAGVVGKLLSGLKAPAHTNIGHECAWFRQVWLHAHAHTPSDDGLLPLKWFTSVVWAPHSPVHKESCL